MENDVFISIKSRIFSESSTREISGMVGAVLFLLWGVFLPSPHQVSPLIQSTIAVFGFALILWLTEAVPYVISSSLSVVLLFALGITDNFQTATTGFSSNLVFFLFFLFLLGQSISKVNLDSWFASRLLSSSTRTIRPMREIASHLLLLSFFMPSAAARAITFVPIARQMVEYKNQDIDDPFSISSFLIISHINPIASMAFMTGGGMAIVTAELIANNVQPISWVKWAILMIPPVFLLYFLSYLTLEIIYKCFYLESEVSCDQQKITQPKENVGSQSFSPDQRIVGLILVGTVFLWIIGSFINIPPLIPAALAVFLLAIPPIGILTSEDLQDMSWGILFILGAMLSILEAFELTGTLSYITQVTSKVIPFATFSHWQVIALLLILAAFIRLLFSTGSAALIVTIPIFLQYAEKFGINKLYLALGMLLVIGSTSLLPFNTTATLISFNQGPLSNRAIFSFGLVTMIYSLFVVAISWTFYWPLIT